LVSGLHLFPIWVKCSYSPTRPPMRYWLFLDFHEICHKWPLIFLARTIPSKNLLDRTLVRWFVAGTKELNQKYFFKDKTPLDNSVILLSNRPWVRVVGWGSLQHIAGRLWRRHALWQRFCCSASGSCQLPTWTATAMIARKRQVRWPWCVGGEGRHCGPKGCGPAARIHTAQQTCAALRVRRILCCGCTRML